MNASNFFVDTKPIWERVKEIEEGFDRQKKCLCGEISATLAVNVGENGCFIKGIVSEKDNPLRQVIAVLNFLADRCGPNNRHSSECALRQTVGCTCRDKGAESPRPGEKGE